MPVVIGLGNPGPRYAETRHNLGFMAVDRLSEDLSAGPWVSEGPAVVARAGMKAASVLLAKPMTFMNRSGEAAALLAGPGGAPLADLLVICDDLNLPLGTLRLRRKGGDGGHKGLASIIEALGTGEFARLRLGIGPDPGDDLTGFVLSPFPDEERAAAEAMARTAAQAALAWIREGPEGAMNRYNKEVRE